MLVDLDRRMREMLSSGEGDGGDLLLELLRLPRRLSGVSEDVARGMLRMPRAGKVPDVPTV